VAIFSIFQYWKMVLVKEQHSALDSKNLNCARLRGLVSNSWVLAVLVILLLIGFFSVSLFMLLFFHFLINLLFTCSRFILHLLLLVSSSFSSSFCSSSSRFVLSLCYFDVVTNACLLFVGWHRSCVLSWRMYACYHRRPPSSAVCWQSNVLGQLEITQPVRWPLFCRCRANAVEQSAWTASATGYHLRTIQTIAEKRLCLVSWAAAPCVWTLTALTRNLLTYLLTYSVTY